MFLPSILNLLITYICVFKFTVSDNHGLLPTLPDSVNLGNKKERFSKGLGKMSIHCMLDC